MGERCGVVEAVVSSLLLSAAQQPLGMTLRTVDSLGNSAFILLKEKRQWSNLVTSHAHFRNR